MKRSILLFLCLFLLMLPGCGKETEISSVTEPTPVTAPEIAETLPTIAQTQPETEPTMLFQPVQEPTQTIPAQPQETLPQKTEFHTIEEFRGYLYQQLEAGNLEMTFRYTGFANDMTAENIARMGSLMYVQCLHEGEDYHVIGWKYPGERMVEAYRSGSWDALNAEETLALENAIQMVNHAKETASGELELEIALFDMLRQRVTYNNGSPEITDPENPPRYLTAVGALLDGSANCQGYVDGFYVLASIAGFQVGKMHVDIPSGGHVVNVICIDGSWYVVDATFNDYDDPSGVQVSYRLFNAGVDKCSEYSWKPVMERHILSRESGPSYYYYSVQDGIPGTFQNLNAMAESIVEEWVNRGVANRYLMLEGASASWISLSDALNVAANTQGVQISYHIWTETNRQDTFFYVELE